ncbi:MAG: hypothetical protein M3N32_09005 [Actinomycetota bacterium]|nr:hypothetical protein [Actinomycetota bacterium]
MRRSRGSALVVITLTSLLAMSLPVAGHKDPTKSGAGRPASQQAPEERFDDGVIDSGLDAHRAHQHGGEGGHLPPTRQNVELVSKLELSGIAPGRIGDVGVFGNYAYLAAYAAPECEKGGIYVIDISDLQNPKEVAFIHTGENSFVGEGVHITHIDTPAFTGEVLAFNNEICGDVTPTTVGGLTLFDVSNPTLPVPLAQGAGDFDPPSVTGANIAHQIHSTFIWDAGDKAYAVLVDDEEPSDVDIMDISNPRKPVLIAEYELDKRFPQIIQEELGGESVFLHDVIVKQIAGRWIMLLSYWDGGYVVADVTRPRRLTYLASSDFTIPDVELLESTGIRELPEGNAHQAEFSRDNRFIVAADEDFAPFALHGTNVTDSEEFDLTPASDSPPVKPESPLEGQTVFLGHACPGDPALPAGDGSQIAVVERGVCTFSQKVATVEAAGGYIAVIVFNREGPDACTRLASITAEGKLPVLFVGRDVGLGLFNMPYDEAACRAGSAQAPIAIGTAGDRVRVKAVFNGWGYVHLYRNQPGKLVELDTYAIPEAHDPAFAEGFGDLSVHEVAMSEQRNKLAYFAYYAGGFRVARILGHKLVETGRFIDEGGNNFWGVQVFQRGPKEYVAASDRDFGLYIFRYTGPGKP